MKKINENIKIVDNNINQLDAQKTIIKEIYHEKINSISNYNDAQIDSFFTDRYNKD